MVCIHHYCGMCRRFEVYAVIFEARIVSCSVCSHSCVSEKLEYCHFAVRAVAVKIFVYQTMLGEQITTFVSALKILTPAHFVRGSR